MSENRPKIKFNIKTTHVLLGIIVLVIIMCIVVSVKDYYFLKFIIDEYAVLFTTLAILIMSIFGSVITKTQNKDFEVKLTQLKTDRENITRKIENDDNLNIFHTIQLSLNQLDEYYTINKSQATTSFRISVSAITLGLLIILLGIGLSYNGSKNVPLTYLTGVSSILLEFIGGAYFFMYKKSLEQVNFFFGQLIRVQDTMLAIKMVEEVKDDNKKVEMTDKIIVSLLERSLK